MSAEEKRAQAIAEGNVALCNNGDFSNNTDFGKTCSGADGLDEWLAEYGECNDGTTIKMAKNSVVRRKWLQRTERGRVQADTQG